MYMQVKHDTNGQVPISQVVREDEGENCWWKQGANSDNMETVVILLTLNKARDFGNDDVA